MYEPRFYRNWAESQDLISFNVQISESDLHIRAQENLCDKSKELLLKYRYQLESYIKTHPEFLTTLEPFKVDKIAPEIVKDMADAGTTAGVGPMAAVAGAIAGFIGRDLMKLTKGDVIIENGGDDFIFCTKPRKVGIYAGDKLPALYIEIEPQQTPCGICTSSGKMGPSLSFGKADSVTIISKSCSLADAAATAVGNMVKTETDIEKSLESALAIQGVEGVIIAIGKKIGIKGNVKLA
jgi:hypothetical protein